MASFSARFPTLTPRISELYGANSGVFRVGEAESYAQELEELEREERALENTVQELVNRQAAVPIGVKFHRDGGIGTVQREAVAGSEVLRGGEVSQDPDIPYMRSSSSEEEDEEEDEEDIDEDEMMDEDEEEGEETTGRVTLVRGEGQQREEDDSFTRDIESGDDSMEMEELPPSSD